MFTTNQLTRFVLLHWRSLLYKIFRGVTERYCLSKKNFPAKDHTRSSYRTYI